MVVQGKEDRPNEQCPMPSILLISSGSNAYQEIMGETDLFQAYRANRDI